MSNIVNMAKIALTLAEERPELTIEQYRETLLVMIEQARIEKIGRSWIKKQQRKMVKNGEK